MTIYIVTDNNMTDGECGYIIGVTDEYEKAVFLKQNYIDSRPSTTCSDSRGQHIFLDFARRYPHNVEILEKELA